jgi:hypothetical protein
MLSSSKKRVNWLTPRHDQKALLPTLMTLSARPWRPIASSKVVITASARSPSQIVQPEMKREKSSSKSKT